jgi:hypothetical protein
MAMTPLEYRTKKLEFPYDAIAAVDKENKYLSWEG